MSCSICAGYALCSSCPACSPDPVCECGSSALWDHRDGSDGEPPLCVPCARGAGLCCDHGDCTSPVEDEGSCLGHLTECESCGEWVADCECKKTERSAA